MERGCMAGQVGLQGVDNGAIKFTNVRIPRDNLLDRFGQLDRAGNYSSNYSANRRFAATLGELTGGRVGLTCGSVGILKVPLRFLSLEGSVSVYGSMGHGVKP